MSACQSKSKSEQLPFYVASDLTPTWLDETDTNYANIHQIADFSFTDRHGDHVTQQYVDGKIYIANFFFTSCGGICPMIMHNLEEVYDTIIKKENVHILSHTVMPWVDDAPQLQKYAQRMEIPSENWKLLTGTKADLYSLARQSYFADEGLGKNVTSADDFLHTENVFLIDSKRRIRGVYNGTLPLDLKRMLEDLEILENE